MDFVTEQPMVRYVYETLNYAIPFPIFGSPAQAMEAFNQRYMAAMRGDEAPSSALAGSSSHLEHDGALITFRHWRRTCCDAKDARGHASAFCVKGSDKRRSLVSSPRRDVAVRAPLTY